MLIKNFLKNKITRQIKWNGKSFKFTRYKKNEYHEFNYNEVEMEVTLEGVFHEGGGYGGMLNIELYSRDGGRTVSKMKPMILCLKNDNSTILDMDDVVKVGDYIYKVVEKNDIQNLGIAFEISLEIVNER